MGGGRTEVSNADRRAARTIRGMSIEEDRRSDGAEKDLTREEKAKDQENRRNTKDKALITGPEGEVGEGWERRERRGGR